MDGSQNPIEHISEHSKVDAIVESYSCEKSALIAILQDIENLYDYLPAWTLRYVSEKLDVPLIQVYGVASFYDAFHLTPPGKHLIRVCLGTACHVRGGQRVMEELERQLKVEVGKTTKDLKFTLERVNCVGCCALGPMVIVDENYQGHMSPAKVSPLLKKIS